MKISGFVISYNGETTLETCLQSIRWVDELVVVDKSSTDTTPQIARRYADKYLRVPWSPTVEESRSQALATTDHNFVVFLDDDECLSVEAAKFLRSEAENPRADVYRLPCRHYVLGEHSENAYYWPQSHIRAFLRGAVEFNTTVHGGQSIKGKVYDVAADTGVCFHNFSHPDVASWIEKTNRYTGVSDRVSATAAGSDDISEYTFARLNYWLGRSHSRDDYTDSVAVLRAIYDIVDRLKLVEASRGVLGRALFGEVMAALRQDYLRESSVQSSEQPKA